MVKKILFLFSAVLFSVNIFSQGSGGTIGAFQISPSQPTTNDTIFVFADVQFLSSDCILQSSNHSVNGNTIVASAHHCLGMLSAICNTTDTFVFLPLAAGTYTFDLTLTSGFGSIGVPCTPGIIPDDNQDFQFTVMAAQSPCVLTGGMVTVPYPASPIMMDATVNGTSQYTYAWNNGATANQNPFYSNWCVTITDSITGCDTSICEDCIPTGGFGSCPFIYAPVCGCDGNIYSNDCVAMYNGIFTFSAAMGPNGQVLPCPQIQCNVDIGAWPTDSLDCANGDTLILEATNGFDTYFWSTGDTSRIIEISTPGIYIVTAVDSNGCNDIDSIVVFCQTSSCFLEINNGTIDIEICDGDTAILEATNGFDTYFWSTNETSRIIAVTNAGIYTVVATNILNNCAEVDSIEVIVYPSLPLSIYSAPSPPYICLGDSIVLEATTGFVSYSWNNGMSGDRIVDYPTQDTWYLVEAVDSNGCVVKEDIMVYVDTCSTGINYNFDKNIFIYPNPTNGKVNIELPKNKFFEISLLEISGKLISRWSKVEGQLIVNENLSKGIYIIKVEGKQSISNFKLIRK